MIKVIQVKPRQDYLPSATFKVENDISKSKVLLVDSMLNPNSQAHLKVEDILNGFDVTFKIDKRKISQVDKKTTIEWFDFSSTYDSVIIVVGDCATCTFKASQDIKELNDRNIPTYLITFSEMKSLVFQDTLKIYPERLFYFDEENFIKKLKKEFS
tara:strand:- start:445 stop:912 length:468 start_codon:yes stop_codon:yes gene_type:complete